MERERVLVVDDDPGIRTLVAEVFRDRGAEVEVAGDGGEAIKALRRNPGRFALIVTDFQMPGMDGLDLLDYVVTARIGVPVIMLSGLAANAWVTGEAIARGAAAVIGKPFLIKDLVEQADASCGRAGTPATRSPVGVLSAGAEVR